MGYDFDQIVDRRGTWSMKWDYQDYFRVIVPTARIDEETIHLQVADMDFACAPMITKALQKAAAFPNFGYTVPGACPEYVQSIIRWNERHHQITYKEEEILWCGSALEPVRIGITGFTNPGDGVIVTMPVYSNFMGLIHQYGRTVVNVPLVNNEEVYTMDWDGFEEACAKTENKLFILCSPSNPTGRVWTSEELAKMAAICRKHDVIIVADEIHSDFVWKGHKHVPILKAAKDLSNLILVTGPNKTFNLMGLGCAYAVIPDKELRSRYLQYKSGNGPTVFHYAATIAAYDESEEWLDALNEYLESNVEYVVEFLQKHFPQVKVKKPEGTYIVWADFSGFGLSADELAQKTNLEGNVFLQGGHGCDPYNGDMYERICTCLSRPLLEKAMQSLCKVLNGKV